MGGILFEIFCFSYCVSVEMCEFEDIEDISYIS